MKNKVYEFVYNPCTFESGGITISLHFSREGAEKALEEHKAKELEKYKEYEEDCDLEGYKPVFEFGDNEEWYINEVEILP